MNAPALPPAIRADLAKMGPERREWRCEDLAMAAVLVDDFADAQLAPDPERALSDPETLSADLSLRAVSQSFRNIVAAIRREFPS